MARPVLNIKPISLLKILLDCSKITRDPSSLLQDWLFKSFVYSVTLAICLPALANARCESPAATLESVEGTVEWSVSDDRWQQAVRGDAFCYGDKIRVLEQRAALRLANETVVRLRENSVVTLMPEDKGFWVELLQGAGHFLSRTPKQLTIKAAYLNAAIDGTEFIVAADGERNRVAVFEGEVRVFNQFGEVQLGEGTETSATATSAPDPARSIRLRDAAEWILYYPPLIIQNQADSSVSSLIDKERYAEALNQLDRQTMGAEDATLAASLALISGQPAAADKLLELALEQNPQLPEANALQALKALTAGDDQAALSQTSSLLQTAPENVSVLLAHAYALQSQGKIEEALKINRRALSRAPDNLFILARTAELELSSGNTRAARKLIDRALPQAPNHSRLNTLAGFIALNRFSNKEAQSYFRTAINSNDSEPLARLGLALALIQKGKIEEGRAEMEMAVMLDPGSSLLRSYLGKTYATQNQNDWADTQYQLAKNLDPNDPTPWFYQAHLKHEENKPGEALVLITTAIEKNDNRAVYRSRMFLDSDAAARSANLAGIYKNSGFKHTATVTAANAVTQNPMDFAGHFALTAAYTGEASTQILRAREALLTRILAPIGARALPVGVGEVGIPVYPWISPGFNGLNEYSSLFTKPGFSGNFSAFNGSQKSRGLDWTAQAYRNRTSISGGQYSYFSNGYDSNNDLDIKLNEGTIHHQMTDKIKLFGNVSKKDDASGDRDNPVYSSLYDETLRRKNSTNKTQLGLNYQATNNTQINSYITQYQTDANTKSTIFVAPDFQIESNLSSKIDEEDWELNIKNKFENLVVSSGIQQEKVKIRLQSPITGAWEQTDDTKFSQIYATMHHQTLKDLAYTGGIKYYEWSNNPDQIIVDDSKFGYDVGLSWRAANNLDIAFAKWNSIAEYLPRNGSLNTAHIFAIPTTDETSANTEIDAFAFHGNMNFANSNIRVLAKHEKFSKLFDLPTQSITIPIEQDSALVGFEKFIAPNLAFSTALQSTRNSTPLLSAFGTIASASTPIRIDKNQIDIDLNYSAGSILKLACSVIYIEQKLRFIDTSTSQLDEVRSKGERTNGVILNSVVQFSFPKEKINIRLIGHDLGNSKIGIQSRSIQNTVSSYLPEIANIPPERSLFGVITYQLN